MLTNPESLASANLEVRLENLEAASEQNKKEAADLKKESEELRKAMRQQDRAVEKAENRAKGLLEVVPWQDRVIELQAEELEVLREKVRKLEAGGKGEGEGLCEGSDGCEEKAVEVFKEGPVELGEGQTADE